MYNSSAMEGLPFGLARCIIQYNEIVFPEDKDVIIRQYDKLLEYTIKNNKLGQLRLLIDIKKCDNPEAIHWACAGGYVDCVACLNDNGAPMDECAIEEAAEGGHYDCIKYLIDNNCPKSEYATAIADTPECLELLIKAEFPMTSYSIQCFAEIGKPECVKLLIAAKCPMDSNVIKISCAEGHVECVKLLIDANCPMDAKATYYAAYEGSTQCLQLLIEAGCEIHPDAINVARGNGHHDCIKLLQQSI